MVRFHMPLEAGAKIMGDRGLAQRANIALAQPAKLLDDL